MADVWAQLLRRKFPKQTFDPCNKLAYYLNSLTRISNPYFLNFHSPNLNSHLTPSLLTTRLFSSNKAHYSFAELEREKQRERDDNRRKRIQTANSGPHKSQEQRGGSERTKNSERIAPNAIKKPVAEVVEEKHKSSEDPRDSITEINERFSPDEMKKPAAEVIEEKQKSSEDPRDSEVKAQGHKELVLPGRKHRKHSEKGVRRRMYKEGTFRLIKLHKSIHLKYTIVNGKVQFTWRKSVGDLAPVAQDQGDFDTCWAVTLGQCLNLINLLKTGQSVRVSAQHMIGWNYLRRIRRFKQEDIRYMGNPFDALRYFQRTGGLFLESHFPYTGKFEAKIYKKKVSMKKMPRLQVDGCRLFNVPNEIMAKILKIQPFIVWILGEAICYPLYTKGVLRANAKIYKPKDPYFYRPRKYNSNDPNMEVNHLVTCIGEVTFDNVDCWVMLNSYGPKFGYEGEFLIEKSNLESGAFGINIEIVVPYIK